MHKIAVNDLGVPFTEHFDQPLSIAQCLQRVPLIRLAQSVIHPVWTKRTAEIQKF
jgi:hypothetical protein